MTLALSSFFTRAVVMSRTKAERIPGTLLTALLIPTPVPIDTYSHISLTTSYCFSTFFSSQNVVGTCVVIGSEVKNFTTFYFKTETAIFFI